MILEQYLTAIQIFSFNQSPRCTLFMELGTNLQIFHGEILFGL